MANRNVFHKVLTPLVELQYPHLDGTHRFNVQEQRSEPCSPTAAGAAWSVSWSLPLDAAKKLQAELKDHYNACRAEDKSLPEFARIFGAKKQDDGTVQFRAKRNGTKASGDVNTPPKVIDGAKNALEDKAIWGGSKGVVRALAFPSKAPDGTGGISLMLDAVQVVEPVYGGNGLDDFDDHGSSMSSVDPFGDTAPAGKPVAQPAAEADDEF